MSNLKERADFLWEGIANNYTPDGPVLRYGGPIPVFLYGKLADQKHLQKFLSKHNLFVGGDMVTKSYRCETMLKYVALVNKSNPTENLVYYPDFIVHKPTERQDLTSRQVRGKLVTCSMALIKELDIHFYNTVFTDRISIRLETSADDKPVDAFAYVFKKDFLFSKDCSLKKGFAVKPFNVESSARGKYYFL